MNNMTVVYADAEEKYVKNVILYGKTADNYLYTDSKCSEVNKVDKDTLLNLCKKGVIINYNSTYYMPLFFKEESGGSVSVTYKEYYDADGNFLRREQVTKDKYRSISGITHVGPQLGTVLAETADVSAD